MQPDTHTETAVYAEGRANRLLMALVAATMVISANATTYYWYGGIDSDPLNPRNYGTRDVNNSQDQYRLSELPEPGSVIATCDSTSIRVDDSSIAYLSSLDTMQLRDGTKLVIDISTNSTVAAKFYRQGGTGMVVKRGLGTLFLGPVATSTSDYYTTFIVERGNLVFPQSGQTANSEYLHSGLVVSNGCKVILDGGRATSAFRLRFRKSATGMPGGFCGAGDIAYTNDSVACTLYAGGTDELFTGVISGDKLKLQVSGDLMLANSANTLAYDGANEMYHQGGTLGFLKFGSTSATETSSFGKLNKKIQTSGSGTCMFLCLAKAEDGPQSASRTIGDYNTGVIGFDGGAYGAFTFAGNLWSVTDANRIKELVLTGSNTTECSWSGEIAGYSGGKNYGSYYLTKRGSGTWSMAALRNTSTKLAKLAGISVENGTLAFYSLAEQGTMCSIGEAPASLLYGYPYKGVTNGVPTVDYAIRLGNATNLTEEGCLEKRKTSLSTVTECSTRHIAVTGRGRLRNGAEADALSWKGVKSVVPPENADAVPVLSTLTLDGDGRGLNTLSDITEDDGAAPLRIAKEGSASWTLSGRLAFTGGLDVREGVLNATTLSYPVSFLRVDGGATLNLTGDAATVNAWSIDADRGIGTINGISFADHGTISIANAAEYPVTIACDLTGCVGIDNISDWAVRTDMDSVNLVATACPSGIMISKIGFVILFR